MTEPFVGEIRSFGFNFAPRGYAFCNGQAVSISQNTALFAILGTFYGGDGRSTFNLPNLQGRSTNSVGQSPGGSSYVIGQVSGTTTVTLQNVTQLPSHRHTFTTVISSSNTATNKAAAGSHLGRTFSQLDFTNLATPDTTLAPQMIGSAGGGQPHANQQPYLTINFCIALQGIFPSRN